MEKLPAFAYWAVKVSCSLSIGFSRGDRSYTGEAGCPFWFGDTAAINISEQFRTGQLVAVRYRRDNPCVNKWDRGVWEDLDGL